MTYTAATNFLTDASAPSGNPLGVATVNGAAANVGQPVPLGKHGAKVAVMQDGTVTVGGFTSRPPAGTVTVLGSFTYAITDGAATSKEATVHVKVKRAAAPAQPDPEPPVLSPVTELVIELPHDMPVDAPPAEPSRPEADAVVSNNADLLSAIRDDSVLIIHLEPGTYDRLDLKDFRPPNGKVLRSDPEDRTRTWGYGHTETIRGRSGAARISGGIDVSGAENLTFVNLDIFKPTGGGSGDFVVTMKGSDGVSFRRCEISSKPPSVYDHPDGQALPCAIGWKYTTTSRKASATCWAPARTGSSAT